MPGFWRPEEAREACATLAREGGEATALCLYAARLLGRDPALVLHGGGNASVKDAVEDPVLGRLEVLRIKASGADMATLGPEGLPALSLPSLRALAEVEELDDATLRRELLRARLDPDAPAPSVEALLHAFLPHRYVLHSHPDAVLAITNRAGAREHLHRALADTCVVVPYARPGLPLARAVAAAVAADPDTVGVIVLKHGLFTFADDARRAYERHMAVVDAVEQYLLQATAGCSPPRPAVPFGVARERALALAPVLRGALARAAAAGGGPEHLLLEWRGEERVRGVVDDPEGRILADTLPITPDHTLRIKPWPLWLEPPAGAWEDESILRRAVEEALAAWRRRYEVWCREGQAGVGPRELPDPVPRVVCVPGCGVFGAGPDAALAGAAAALAEHNLRAKAAARSLGAWEGLEAVHHFDMETWPLQRAKLAAPRPELAGRVALVTGGGGAIGEGVARVLADAGAVVVLLDRDRDRAEAAAGRVAAATAPGRAWALQADVTDRASLTAALDEVVLRHGGLDILVPNAGAARVAGILEEDPEAYRRLVEVNQVGVLLTLQVGGEVLRRQGRGGSVVLVSSKNVPAPGADFGAYSSSKAGAHQLARVAALEWARHGIRVNMVCPDAVFSCGDNPSGLWQEVGPDRARSRGLRPEDLQEYYVERNLLHCAVTAEDVGRAVLFFAAGRTPTTGAWLPVDGGVPGAFPR